MLYPKIDTLYHRDEKTKKLIEGTFSIPAVDLIKTWEFTEKLDGTNIGIRWSEETTVNNPGIMTIHGRTLEAEVPKAIISFIQDRITPEKMNEHFGRKNVSIYGEGVGGKIQAGANDKERGGKYFEAETFIVFDIRIGHYWLKRLKVVEICQSLGLEMVPFVGQLTLEEAVNRVRAGFKSSLGGGTLTAEGLVGVTNPPLYDGLGRRLITKIKTRDFK